MKALALAFIPTLIGAKALAESGFKTRQKTEEKTVTELFKCCYLNAISMVDGEPVIDLYLLRDSFSREIAVFFPTAVIRVYTPEYVGVNYATAATAYVRIKNSEYSIGYEIRTKV